MRHRFEDLAVNCIAKRKPNDTDMATYIGLEHLDAGDLRVTRFGSKVPIKGEKLLMKKGDVLFGRRNTYLKRAAVAPHDGLFSAHGMVLRPKEAVVAGEFFPFFISSDYFFNAAIRISVGSISPTVNWGTLKNLEFDLPPLDEQRKLAGLLRAANATREAYKKLLAATDELVKSQFVEMFGDLAMNDKGWSVKLFAEFAKIDATMTTEYENYADYPHIGIDSIESVTGELKGYRTVKQDGVKSGKYIFTPAHIIYSKIRPNLNKVALPTFDGLCSADAYPILNNSANCDKVFLAYVLRSQLFLTYILPFSYRTNFPKVNREQISGFTMPLPPLTLQHRFADFVRQADKSKFALKRALDELESTYKALLRDKLG